MNVDTLIGRSRARRSLHRLRTEGDSPGRQAAAFGLGTFIGCSPAFGFHLPLCLLGGWLLNLNRLKMYLAANISNPFVAPFLLFAEIQVGRLLRTGAPFALSLDALRGVSVWNFAADLLIGSVVVGAALSAVAATSTYVLVRRYGTTPRVSRLFSVAADRYVDSGVFAWESANGKLRLDPVFREVLRQGLLPDEGVLVDVGCGRGLMLSLLVSARDCRRDGRWPEDWPPPPMRLSLHGVELRPHIAADGARALAGEAVIEVGDACAYVMPRANAVLLFDVLHMLPSAQQDRLLARIVEALEPGGVLVVREADAAAGWRARLIALANWSKAVFERNPGRRFHFRSADQWLACFARLGLTARVCPTDDTRMANVLFEARLPGPKA